MSMTDLSGLALHQTSEYSLVLDLFLCCIISLYLYDSTLRISIFSTVLVIRFFIILWERLFYA